MPRKKYLSVEQQQDDRANIGHLSALVKDIAASYPVDVNLAIAVRSLDEFIKTPIEVPPPVKARVVHDIEEVSQLEFGAEVQQ